MKIIWKTSVQNILVWLMLAFFSIFFLKTFGNLAQDDAFITFRYAKNITVGNGFVYNNGEWVLGTTTPLYTLVLAGAAALTKFDILRISTVINTVSLWLAAGFLYELTKPADKVGATFLSLIFTTSPFLRNYIGMESYFLLFFLIFTIYLYRKENFWAAGFANGLLVLIRYEMIFLSFIFLVWEIWKKKKFPYWMVPGGVLVLVWILYASLTFGSPIPLSVSAKLIAPKHSFLVGGAAYLYLLIHEFFPAIFIVLFVLPGLWGIVKKKYIQKEYLFILLFSVVYLIAASLTAGAFPWYYAPLLPAFSILVLVGIKTTASPPNFFTSGWSEVRKKQTIFRLQTFFMITLVFIQIAFLAKNFFLTRNTIGDNRYAAYTQIAKHLDHCSEQTSIASFEIGYLGYFSDCYIVDIAGLVTPTLLPWVGLGAEETIFHAIQIFSPNYVVVPCGNSLQVSILEESNLYQFDSKFEEQFCLYKSRSD